MNLARVPVARTVGLAVVVSLAACSPNGGRPASTPLSPMRATPPPSALFPQRGAYLGARVQPAAGQSEDGAIAAAERAIGRPFAVERVYHRWWDAFPTESDRLSAASGRLLFISWAAQTAKGAVVPWAAIASGEYDRWIRARAEAVATLGRPLYLCFNHEPEDESAWGSPAEFVAAYRRIVDVFRSEGVSNVAYVWTLMSRSFTQGAAVADAFYPGDSYVDAVGVDAYNWAPGRAGAAWRSFATVVAPARRFAMAHDRPLVVPEFGVQEDPSVPGRKAAWLRDAAATIRRWHDVKAVMYFDSNRGYPWTISSSTSSQAAFAEVAADPWFDPPPRPSPAG